MPELPGLTNKISIFIPIDQYYFSSLLANKASRNSDKDDKNIRDAKNKTIWELEYVGGNRNKYHQKMNNTRKTVV